MVVFKVYAVEVFLVCEPEIDSCQGANLVFARRAKTPRLDQGPDPANIPESAVAKHATPITGISSLHCFNLTGHHFGKNL